MKKVVIPVFLIISIFLIAISCNDGIDLKKLIETDVKLNNNPKHFLTIESTLGGTVSPSGRVEIVDELPNELLATPDEGYAFKGWEFLTGEKSANLSEAAAEGGNTLTVSDGDVVIRAVFVRQPVVISYYPKDEDVAKNMPVRIVFSKPLDTDSVTSSTIQIFDNQTGSQIEGIFEISGSELLFFAQDPSLQQTTEGLYLWESNRHYQVFIRQNIQDSDEISLLEEISWFFSTGTDEDNTPPEVDFFNAESPLGSNTHTNTCNVELSFDAEDESRIPIRAVKYWNNGESEPDDPVLLDEVADDETGKISFQIPEEDGPKQINFKVYDMSNNYTEITTSITLDTIAPTLDPPILNDPDEADHNSDNFANRRDMSFQLTGDDAVALVADVNGWLGWVIDNPEGEMTWIDYTEDPVDFWLPDSDGEHTVYFAVRDEAGNESVQDEASITLDRTAPTGTIQIKDDTGWICGNDQFATISLTRSDLSTSLEEIVIAVQVDGDGWSTGDLSTPRTWSSSLTDVDLIPVSETHVSGDEVTVSVKLIDTFEHERIITEIIGLDFISPTVSSFYIQSLDGASYARTDYCKAEGAPLVQLVIAKSDTGGSGLGGYRYDTDESGIDWSNWTSDSSTSISPDINLTDKWGTKTVSLQVSDKAGNVSTTYTDNILNCYRATFQHSRVYVNSNSEASGYSGEMYWRYDLRYFFGASNGYYYGVFDLPYSSNIQKGDNTYIEYNEFSSTASHRYHYYGTALPSTLRIQGYLKEYDTSSAIDISEFGYLDWSPNGTGAWIYLYTGNDSSYSSGNPKGYIRYTVTDNY